MRVEPIEPEDDQLLIELSGRPPAAAAPKKGARDGQRYRERHDSRSAGVHRDHDYSNRFRCSSRPTRVLYAGIVRALGIDFGRRRIGLALSDPTGLLARPWKTIERRGQLHAVADELARAIAGLRDEADGLDAVVVGLPRRLNGEPTELTRSVEMLADRLRALTGVVVVLQDERLSSREAESLLARREKDWRKRKAALDATAAAVILQDYLDSADATRPAAGEDGHQS